MRVLTSSAPCRRSLHGVLALRSARRREIVPRAYRLDGACAQRVLDHAFAGDVVRYALTSKSTSQYGRRIQCKRNSHNRRSVHSEPVVV